MHSLLVVVVVVKVVILILMLLSLFGIFWKSVAGVWLYTETLWKSRNPKLFKKVFTNSACSFDMLGSYLCCELIR